MGGAIEASAQQVEATDAQIDVAIAALKAAPNGPDYDRLQQLAQGNWPRVIWNYKRADGSLRARILVAAHYNYFSPTPLDDLACQDPSWSIRQMGAVYVERSIVNGKLPPSAEKLQSKLAGDPAWQVRIVVAKGLQWQGPRFKPTLIRYTRDPSRFVRLQAGMSLARQKDVRAIPVLVELLDKQAGFPIVMDVGGEWRPEEFLADFGEKIIPAVVPKLKSKSPAMRLEAIAVLFLADVPKLFDYGKTLVNDHDPQVRFMALRAMAWHRNPKAVPYLVKALREEIDGGDDSTIRNYISLLLGSEPDSGGKVWPQGLAALRLAGIKL